MRTRWMGKLALGGWLSAAPVFADDPRPTELPLLPVPPDAPKRPAQPPPDTPGRDVPEYNPALMYLPDRIPTREGPPCPCGPAGTAWAGVELLFGATSGSPLPPLVTTAKPGTPRWRAAQLADPLTSVLVGDQLVNNEVRPGFRLDAGLWLNDCHTFGVAAGLFFLGEQTTHFAADSTGSPILARPFTNVTLGDRPDAVLIAYPGTNVGAVTVDTSRSVLGAGADGRWNLLCGSGGRVDLLGGYRYVLFEDRLRVDSATSPPSGRTTTAVSDRFATDNHFHGGQLGVAGGLRHGWLSLDAYGKVALGIAHTVVSISGETVVTPAGGSPDSEPEGLLARSTNSGRHVTDEFAVVPEVGVNVGVRVTDHVRAYAGYSFLYWSSVTRAGDQVDLFVNLTGANVASGPDRPQYPAKSSDLWVQALSLGMEVRY